MKILPSVIADCGGAAALARQLKSKHKTRRGHLSRQAIYAWKRIPIEHVHDICELTGGKYQPNDLRPDVFKAAP